MNANPNSKELTASLDFLKKAWPVYLGNPAVAMGGSVFLNLVPFIIVGIPASIVAFGTALSAGLSHQKPSLLTMLPIILISAPAFAALYNYLRAGWVRMLLKMANGESASFSEIFAGKPWFVSMLITKVIIGIGTAIGGVLFVIPGVYLAIRTAFAEFLVIDEDLPPIEALKKSHEMVTGHAWQLLIFYGILFVGNMITSAIPVIGTFLPMVMLGLFDIALAMWYVSIRRGVEDYGYETDPNR